MVEALLLCGVVCCWVGGSWITDFHSFTFAFYISRPELNVLQHDVVERLMATTLNWSSDVSISRSTVDCNSETFGHEGLCLVKDCFVCAYLTKTFVVDTLYYCSLLCYEKCSSLLLTSCNVLISGEKQKCFA